MKEEKDEDDLLCEGLDDMYEEIMEIDEKL